MKLSVFCVEAWRVNIILDGLLRLRHASFGIALRIIHLKSINSIEENHTEINYHEATPLPHSYAGDISDYGPRTTQNFCVLLIIMLLSSLDLFHLLSRADVAPLKRTSVRSLNHKHLRTHLFWEEITHTHTQQPERC